MSLCLHFAEISLVLDAISPYNIYISSFINIIFTCYFTIKFDESKFLSINAFKSCLSKKNSNVKFWISITKCIKVLFTEAKDERIRERERVDEIFQSLQLRMERAGKCTSRVLSRKSSIQIIQFASVVGGEESERSQSGSVYRARESSLSKLCHRWGQ